ncbi:MAG TPA: cold shock domain-containing protein [Bacteroidales bacterium]|nr:cold shock domain-containing protein [Lentimicrobiaceae bacterium]HOH99034.1 cold shock domain-containing protein [Bacteroidales bacterium]
MHQGTVKFFDTTKGFGFIKEEGSEQDHFVHVTGLIDNVKEGDEVTFELQEGRRGLNAVKVRLA